MNAFRPSRHGSRRPRVSFEFFPPKNEEMAVSLWESVRRLEPLGPAFVSVTYGAGGSTRERTHNTVKRMIDETALKPAAHLTCVSASCAEVDEVIRSYWAAGVRHIVALRGDPAGGLGTPYEPHPEGYHQTSDLVEGIRRIGEFEVTVSAYPEKHPEAASLDADIDALKKKVDAGATRAITQFFFDNDVYFRYLDKVRSRGIEIPILPGIVPVQNFKQTAGFGRPLRGAGGRSGDAPAGRCRRLRRAGARPDRSRRLGPALLHDEQGRPGLCDLPSRRPEAREGAGAAGGGGVSLCQTISPLPPTAPRSSAPCARLPPSAS
jgi:methylenetetrahydrofolate reductase (NADPH)